VASRPEAPAADLGKIYYSSCGYPKVSASTTPADKVKPWTSTTRCYILKNGEFNLLVIMKISSKMLSNDDVLRVQMVLGCFPLTHADDLQAHGNLGRGSRG
jgi:hypothetical protein